MIEQSDSFITEIWTLYAIGAALLICRFAVRTRTVGIRGFQGDDYFAGLVLLFYTLDAILVHRTYFDGTNMDYTDDELPQITQAQIDAAVKGSKLQLVAWYSYTALIWSLKGTMLCFFNRLTFGTWQQVFVKWLSVVCAVTYVVVVITISAGCRPYEKNWQVVPLPQRACSAKPQNLLVTAILNIVTDAALLAIPLPLLWRLKVSIRQKLVVAVLLSSGVFVITAALLRVVFSVVPNPSIVTINSWGVRETIVGIISVNVPIFRAAFRKSFWTPGAVSSSSSSSARPGQGYGLSTFRSKMAKPQRAGGGDNDSSDCIVDGKHDILMQTTIEVHRSSQPDLERGVSETTDTQGSCSDWADSCQKCGKAREDGGTERTQRSERSNGSDGRDAIVPAGETL